jgi:hypothetical protein
MLKQNNVLYMKYGMERVKALCVWIECSTKRHYHGLLYFKYLVRYLTFHGSEYSSRGLLGYDTV